MVTGPTNAIPGGWYRNWYHSPVAMNLRLPKELAESLRSLAEETGRSQQELAREALEEYVRDYRLRAYPKEIRHLITPARSETLDPDLVARIRSMGRSAWEDAHVWDRGGDFR